METMRVAQDPHRTWLGDFRNLHRSKNGRAAAKGLPLQSPSGLLDTQTSHEHNSSLSSEGVRKIFLILICPVMKN